MTLVRFIAPAALGIAMVLQSPTAFSAEKSPKALRSCIACHTFAKGKKPKTGPNLYGIVGQKAASSTTYTKYGKDMKAAADMGLVWTPENIDAYIINPKKFLQKITGKKKVRTQMITRIKKAKDRKAIVDFLSTLKD